MACESPTDCSSCPIADLQFARGGVAADTDKVDLRGHIPGWVAGVLDAVCHSQGGIPRIELVNNILQDWARRKAEEATVIQRVLRGNPPPADTNGKPSVNG